MLLRFFTIGLFLVCTSSVAEAEPVAVRQGNISFVYDSTIFSDVSAQKVPAHKLSKRDFGPPFGIAPAHWIFDFAENHPLPALKGGARYFFPAHSFLAVIPQTDWSVWNFQRAYPEVYGEGQGLKKMLRERPEPVPKNYPFPDLPYNNAAHSITSKVQYLDLPWGSAVVFLTQYTQEAHPNPVNNEELCYNIQGLTKDGHYYVCGRFAVTHPSLPRGIDFTDSIRRDSEYLYLTREEAALDKLPDQSFHPQLQALRNLFDSLRIK